ncbi:MAG: GC-type dockerin domain-anchored protein [Phycisphaerales bacterium]
MLHLWSSMVAMSFVLPCLAGGATFQPLGTLDPDGFGPTIAYGTSGDGAVAVGQTISSPGFTAFRWTEERGLVSLGAFPNPGGFTGSWARAANHDGSVIVGSSLMPNSLNEDGSPFRWSAGTGLVWLGTLGGSDGGVARGVSADGSVVVGYGSNANFNPEAFRWTEEGGIVGLGDVAGGPFNSQAAGVSADGSIVVGLASKAFVYDTSFKWTQATGLVQIVPGSFRVVNISRDGHYAVGGNNGRAARVDLGTSTLFSIPHIAIPGLNTDTDLAWGANGDGTVVVGMQNLSQGNGFLGRAFIWDPTHGTRILKNLLVQQYGLGTQLAGWELNCATSVSDDGLTLVGYGMAPSGEQAAWRVVLPNPCPSDLNHDGVVDGADLGALLAAWESSSGPADLNQDGTVDGADLGLILAAWGGCAAF